MNRIQGKYYPRFFPEKIYVPCIKYTLPSKDPIADGVPEIVYAESLHYHKRKELNEKVIITTGSDLIDVNRCYSQISLHCNQNRNEKILYKIKVGVH